MTEASAQCMAATLQPGTSLVASGYCLYSSSTFFCLTLGAGVQAPLPRHTPCTSARGTPRHAPSPPPNPPARTSRTSRTSPPSPPLTPGVQMFTLDTSIGEFVLTHPNLKIPDRGSIYSMNEANRPFWDPPLRAYVEDLQMGKGESEVTYTSRYIGSMVRAARPAACRCTAFALAASTPTPPLPYPRPTPPPPSPPPSPPRSPPPSPPHSPSSPPVPHTLARTRPCVHASL